ncbi:M20 metallopeptidase family protein [Caproiciproducens sp. MSJ-32]|uniref:M20 metallopeptidase family protein n=1 Tax=Caproiciproducens sp. MSJ-32 TaxID=2841527 RepID=UPI001C112D4A|nr:M20 family metallopeptidase [Caproiciproducens sp. MSJ-32]MBU5453890.1 amidohydrolase [Caproiciproducens sp. MSJ-32]
MNFKEEALKIKDELISIRRRLHQYPELGMEEYKTSKYIKNFLLQEKIEYKEYAKTGVCGIIKGTKDSLNNKKNIALRADIDGLPIQDEKSCDYSSKIKGRMHACGHDAHMTILLGAAKILNKNKEYFSGNIKLIFEPAEETIGGARLMIEEGVLENPRVDCICGLHVEETIECGNIMLKSGIVNAASNPFEITIRGSGGHGAYPHNTVDPIIIASHVIIASQTIISREINTLNPAVITVGSIHGGTAKNIIPEEVKISGIIRTMSKEDRSFVKERMINIVNMICKSYRAKAEIKIEDSYPNLYNDKNMVDLFISSAEKVIGRENILLQEYPKMGVESFSYFANEVPAVFYFLGCRNEEKNIINPAHSSLFDIDEECLSIGVAIQCQMAFDYLTRN